MLPRYSSMAYKLGEWPFAEVGDLVIRSRGISVGHDPVIKVRGISACHGQVIKSRWIFRGGLPAVAVGYDQENPVIKVRGGAAYLATITRSLDHLITRRQGAAT
jgi:hypothetical protein